MHAWQRLLNSGLLGLLNDLQENIENSHCTTVVVWANVHVSAAVVDFCSPPVFCSFVCCGDRSGKEAFPDSVHAGLARGKQVKQVMAGLWTVLDVVAAGSAVVAGADRVQPAIPWAVPIALRRTLPSAVAQNPHSTLRCDTSACSRQNSRTLPAAPSVSGSEVAAGPWQSCGVNSSGEVIWEVNNQESRSAPSRVSLFLESPGNTHLL